MKISIRADYAVRAVLDLALHHREGNGVRSAEIARRTGVPEKFLSTVLLDLRKAGLLASKRGPDGGHRLAGDPWRLTVGAVLDAIDGPGAMARKGRRKISAADAVVDDMWRKVESAVQDVVERTTFEDLRQQAETSAALDFSI